MHRLLRCPIATFLVVAAQFVLVTLPARAQSIAGDVSASVAEAGAQALGGALAGATVEPSSGVMKASLPIELPRARGASQPGLALTYSSAAGVREAGVGWGLPLPMIQRSTRRGAPTLADYFEKPRKPFSTAPEPAEPDEFVFNGARLLPICEVGAATKPCNLLGAEPFPAWALGVGTRYYRLEIDSHARFFLSPGRSTWRVQLPGGEILELGRPDPWILTDSEVRADPDASVDYDEIRKLVTKPDGHETAIAQRAPFRWNLVRRYQPSPSGGEPNNVVFYRWTRLGSTGLGYLTDVYYSPPASIASDRSREIAAASFAHHVHLEWQFIPQAGNRYTPTWRATPDYTLARIDVASKRYGKAGSARELVRRYHLVYGGNQRAYLQAFQMEGRCAAPLEEVDGQLPTTSGCTRLPATSILWSKPEQNKIPSVLTAEPAFPFQPPENWRLVPLDVDADGLPDLVETNPEFEPKEDEGSDAFGFLAPMTRRAYVRNDIFFEERTLEGPAALFSRYGYSVTGDFDATARTGAVTFMPVVRSFGCAPEGPCQGREAILRSNTFLVEQIGNTSGLRAFNWQSAPGSGSVSLGTPGSFEVEAVGDVNGDGVPDLVDAHADREDGVEHDRGSIDVRYGLRRPDTSSDVRNFGAAFATASCLGPSRDMMSRSNWGDTTPAPTLADMNGDGLADLVIVGPSNIEYWPGDGRGNFSACRGAACVCSERGAEAISVHMLPPPSLAVGSSARGWHVADVNGDGYADLIVIGAAGVEVFFNIEGFAFSDAILVSFFELVPQELWMPLFNNPEMLNVSFADMNGNGTTDLVLQVGRHVLMWDLHRLSVLRPFPFSGDADAPRPGLVIGIDNGLGARTEFVYTTTAELARNARAAGHPWREAIPQVMQVVSRITTSTSVQGDEPVRIAYAYDDPAWDGYERTFRGFRSVTTTRSGSPALYVRTIFFIPACPGRQCWSRFAATDFAMQQAVSGSPIISETFDEQGRYLSTVSSSYDVVSPMSAYDGTPVRFAYPSRVDTRIYETNDWIASDSVSEVEISRGDRLPIWTGKAPVRSQVNVLLRSTQRKNANGNTVEKIDYGRIKDDGGLIDDPIVEQTGWLGMRPDWKFLPATSSVLPFQSRPGVPADHAHLREYAYDAAGRLIEVRGFLEGSLPLDRRHESALPVAPVPSDASGNNKWLTLASYRYDAFDNVVERRAPNNRCQGVTYDDEFAQLAAKTSAFRSGCGSGSINSTHRWDRGLGLMTEGVEHSGAVTRMSYDGFGRPLASWLPEPATGKVSLQPSATFSYFDIAGGPVQRARLELSGADGRSRVMWSYVDGFGRLLLTLMKADPAAGDDGAWVVRGLPRLGASKLVIGTYAPWFYDGDPAAHPLAPPSPAPALTTVDRDPFTRIVDFHRPDGTVARHNVFRPLSQESVDGAGRRTVLQLDGHGRPIARAAWGDGGDRVVVESSYQVAGETARIVRSHSLGAESISRWMRHDSLGRMVQNAEPNTSSDFDANPLLATAMRSWRYAYNDAGELVGTSDARGCGENLTYDGLGRLVAEDYSPCLSAHAPYSPYKPASGAGAEALFRYDIPEPGQSSGFGVDVINLAGRLVSIMDRASHLRFAYDFRGQQVGLSRRPARPSDSTALWPEGFPATADRYADQWFSASTQYDLFGHVVQFSTGAVSPEMTGFEGLGEIDLAYSDRGLPTAIGGSYGVLIEGTRFAADGRPMSIRYADAAHTQSLFGYDLNRRTQTHEVSRRPPPLWADGAPGYDPPPDLATTQLLLSSFVYHYDAAGLLERVEDQRSSDEWPPGAQPVGMQFQYDRLARMTRADYLRAAPDTAVASSSVDQGIPPALLTGRVDFQSYAYDFTGNITRGDDDVPARYDRSLGDVLYGGSAQGPNQLRSAANGSITAAHDAAGHLVDLVIERAAPCEAADDRCTHRLVYDWDEVGLLARARRWDYGTIAAGDPQHPALPLTAPDIDIRYRYGADGDRVITTSAAADGSQRHVVDLFETLRLQNAAFDTATSAYERSAATEVVRIPGVGRIVHVPGVPRLNGSDRHLLLEFTDHLGSNIASVDHATGELVERSTYQVSGGAESDYRPARWRGIDSNRAFSGHPPDAEVGIVYFGARYYQPALQRWLSADPLTIHGLGADLNPYAYVGGQPSMAVDAHGFASMCTGACEQALSQGFSIQTNEPSFVTTPIRIEAVPQGSSAPVGVNGPPQWHGAMKLMVNFVPVVQGFALLADPARTLNTVVLSRLEVFESLLGEPNTVSDSSYTPARAAGSTGQRAMSDSDQLTSIAQQQVMGAAVGKVGSVVLGAGLRATARVAIREGAIELSGSEFTLFSDQLAKNAARVPAESDGYWNVITHADPDKPWLQTGPGKEDGFYISHRSLARFITKSEGYNGQPIRLIACNAGQCPFGLARNLSNKLGVEVLAPTGKAYINEWGAYWADGVWRRFFPGAW